MDSTKNYVAQEALLSIVKELGLEAVPQAGYIKVAAAKGRAIYIGKTKRVGRVDLSGFEMEGPEAGLVKRLGGESFGAVKQQLRFDLPEEDILSAFKTVLSHMKTLPEAVKEKKSFLPRAPKGAAPKGGKIQSPEEIKAGRIAHLEKVVAYASSIGAPVHKKVTEELASLRS